MLRNDRNAALRLHEFLTTIRAKANDRVAFKNLLSTIFNVAPDDVVAIRRNLLLIDDLFASIPHELEKIHGVDPEAWTKDFPAIRGAIALINLNRPSSDLVKSMPLEVIEALRLIGELLPKEILLGEDEIQLLSDELESLFGFVENGQFEPRLAEITLDIIESLRHAINVYRITGIAAFESALENALGKVFLYGVEHPPNETTLLKRLWKVAVAVEGLVSKAKEYGPLLLEHLPKNLGG